MMQQLQQLQQQRQQLCKPAAKALTHRRPLVVVQAQRQRHHQQQQQQRYYYAAVAAQKRHVVVAAAPSAEAAAAATPTPPTTTTTSTSSSSATTTAPAAAAVALPPALPGARGTVLVVGAGPAGSTTAMLLADAGWQVIVAERRPRPAPGTADQSRTFMLALGERGLRVLDALGVALPPSLARRLSGSVYGLKGKRFEDRFTPGSRIVGVDRQGLTSLLVDAAAARHGHGHGQAAAAADGQQAPAAAAAIAFLFNTPLAGVRFEDRVALLGGAAADPSTGAPAELRYDLLVGADGAFSAVRAALLAAKPPGFSVTPLPSPVSQLEYKSFHDLPLGEGLEEDGEGEGSAGGAAAAAATKAAVERLLPRGPDGVPPDGMTFFAFTNPTPDDPTPGSISLYTNAGGRWSGTLFQPEGRFAAMTRGAEDHAAAVRRFVPEGFPEAWVSAMAAQMAAWGKPGRISQMNVVSRLALPELGAVLVGDAGHSVTPQMGQGCNSALEDAAALAAALRAAAAAASASSSGGGAGAGAGAGAGGGGGGGGGREAAGGVVAAALAAFQARRAPQVHALQRMEAEQAWVRRPPRPLQDPLDKTLARVCWVSFMLLLPLLRRLGLSRALHASFFQNVMSTTAPYDRLHAAVRAAPLALATLLVAAAAAARALLGVATKAAAAVVAAI